MHTAFLRIALLAAIAIASVASLGPAFAASSPVTPLGMLATGAEGPATGADSGTEVEPVAIWSFVVVLLASAAGGVFYLLKKRMGGFPANPAWTAPIEIMRSSTFPDENTYGDVPAEHGHGGHH